MKSEVGGNGQTENRRDVLLRLTRTRRQFLQLYLPFFLHSTLPGSQFAQRNSEVAICGVSSWSEFADKTDGNATGHQSERRRMACWDLLSQHLSFKQLSQQSCGAAQLNCPSQADMHLATACWNPIGKRFRLGVLDMASSGLRRPQAAAGSCRTNTRKFGWHLN